MTIHFTISKIYFDQTKFPLVIIIIIAISFHIIVYAARFSITSNIILYVYTDLLRIWTERKYDYVLIPGLIQDHTKVYRRKIYILTILYYTGPMHKHISLCTVNHFYYIFFWSL